MKGELRPCWSTWFVNPMRCKDLSCRGKPRCLPAHGWHRGRVPELPGREAPGHPSSTLCHRDAGLSQPPLPNALSHPHQGARAPRTHPCPLSEASLGIWGVSEAESGLQHPNSSTFPCCVPAPSCFNASTTAPRRSQVFTREPILLCAWLLRARASGKTSSEATRITTQPQNLGHSKRSI